jgi:hypothetical protein
MASIGLRAAIAHAAVDSVFRQNLLANPAQACTAAGYKLGDAELNSIAEVLGGDAFGSGLVLSDLPVLFENATILVNDVAPGVGGPAAPIP